MPRAGTPDHGPAKVGRRAGRQPSGAPGKGGAQAPAAHGEAADRAEQARAKNREAMRRWREKQKEKRELDQQKLEDLEGQLEILQQEICEHLGAAGGGAVGSAGLWTRCLPLRPLLPVPQPWMPPSRCLARSHAASVGMRRRVPLCCSAPGGAEQAAAPGGRLPGQGGPDRGHPRHLQGQGAGVRGRVGATPGGPSPAAAHAPGCLYAEPLCLVMPRRAAAPHPHSLVVPCMRMAELARPPRCGVGHCPTQAQRGPSGRPGPAGFHSLRSHGHHVHLLESLLRGAHQAVAGHAEADDAAAAAGAGPVLTHACTGRRTCPGHAPQPAILLCSEAGGAHLLGCRQLQGTRAAPMDGGSSALALTRS